MDRITLFTFWFGPYPDWLPRFAERARENRAISWALISDQEKPPPSARVQFYQFSFQQLRSWVSSHLHFPCRKQGPYEFCDFRPTFGELFIEVLHDSAWWGWGDLDCVWGDLDTFLTGGILDGCDVLTLAPHVLGGPFTLIRNIPELNSLWRQRTQDVQSAVYRNYDERGFAWLVDRAAQLGKLRIDRVSQIRNTVRDEVHGCTLRDGKLYALDVEGREQEEILLYHFHEPKIWPVKE